MFKISILASGSTGNCAIISDGETTVMIDAGIPADKIPMIKDVDAILVTHCHGDHAKYAAVIAERYEKPVFAHQSVFDPEQGKHAPIRLRNALCGSDRLTIGGMRIISFPLRHDVPCLGFYLINEYRESLVWIADTSEVDAEIKADVYCIECNYDEETLDERGQSGAVEIGVYGRLISEMGHLSLQSAAAYIQANASKESVVILHHCSQSGNLNIERVESVFGRPVLITPKEYTYGAVCPY